MSPWRPPQLGMDKKTPVSPRSPLQWLSAVTKRGGGGSRTVHPLVKSGESGASLGQTTDDFNMRPTTHVPANIRIKLLPRQCQTFLAAVPAAAMLQVLSNYTFTIDVKISPFSPTLKKKNAITQKPPTVRFAFQRIQVALFISVTRWSFRIKGAVCSCKKKDSAAEPLVNLSKYDWRQLH